MKYLLALILLISLVAATDCGEIKESTILDKSINCEDGIIIAADNVLLDCGDHLIKGIGSNIGIRVQGENAEIKNCRVSSFEVGIFAKEDYVKIENTKILNNLIGLRLERIFKADLKSLTISNNTNFGIYGLDSMAVSEDQLTFEDNGLDKELIELPLNAEILLQRGTRLEYISEDKDAVDARIKRLVNSMKEITIDRKFEEKDGKTIVVLNIKPTRSVELKDAAVYERIPKCFAETVDSIVFDRKMEVLESDPMIKVFLGDIESPTTVSYSTGQVISQSCKDLFKAAGIVEGVEMLQNEEDAIHEGVGAVTKLYPVKAAILVICALAIILISWMVKR